VTGGIGLLEASEGHPGVEAKCGPEEGSPEVSVPSTVFAGVGPDVAETWGIARPPWAGPWGRLTLLVGAESCPSSKSLFRGLRECGPPVSKSREAVVPIVTRPGAGVFVVELALSEELATMCSADVVSGSTSWRARPGRTGGGSKPVQSMVGPAMNRRIGGVTGETCSRNAERESLAVAGRPGRSGDVRNGAPQETHVRTRQSPNRKLPREDRQADNPHCFCGRWKLPPPFPLHPRLPVSACALARCVWFAVQYEEEYTNGLHVPFSVC
jgi:hypothetical protein